MEKKDNLIDLVEQLEKAKQATMDCLESKSCLVDFKGLSCWASEVEDLRKRIDELL